MQNESPPEFKISGDELTSCDECGDLIPLKEIQIKGCGVVCRKCYNREVSNLFNTFKKERIEYESRDSQR